MVEVKNVSKQYGGKTVLEKTSLSIQKGRLTSFIGPNGAGKSTPLSIMSRLIKTDSGKSRSTGKRSVPVKATIWQKNQHPEADEPNQYQADD